MSSVHVTLGLDVGEGLPNRHHPVEFGVVANSQTLTPTSSGDSVTTVEATALGQIWTIDVQTASVWVAFGPAPDASVATARRRLPIGIFSFKARAIGEKVAFRDVA